jgi:hypothetical protein
MANIIARRIPVAWIAVISSGPAGPARNPPGTDRLQKAVVAAVGLAAVARIARDRRTHERIILVAIVLAAAADAARTGEARSKERLIAWDKRQALAVQRRVKAALSQKSLATG